MPKLNKQNIDQRSNKPYPTTTEGLTPDLVLNRAMQTRRDDDVIRTPKRKLYDVDYAIKWFIENEIQPQITAQEQLLSVPVIFAAGEKWDNVRRLGYMRDEKGMLQSPLIMLKRSSVVETDAHRTLDVNRPHSANYFVYKERYNERNRYEDELFPMPTAQPKPSQQVYIVDIPKYVTMEYEMLIWCDFTTQLNDLVDQLLTYGRFSWGNEGNKFPVTIGAVAFETVNTAGEDRLVRATIPLTVQATLLSEHEARISTLKKAYSIKKVVFDVTFTDDIFDSTEVPYELLQSSFGNIIVGNKILQITPEIMNYLTNLTEKQATYTNATTVTIAAFAAINPVTQTIATKNEFDVYINGQYIDKAVYTWTPSDITSQTIVFDTTTLGYSIESGDVIIIKGRWA